MFGTFHSVFFHILKESTGKIVHARAGAERDRLLSRLICGYYPDPTDRPSIEEMEKILRRPPLSYRDAGNAAAVQRDYRAFLKENGYLDFDDMITSARKLLEKDEKGGSLEK